ncbi:multidrug ABC transporter ATP-binding protein [Methanocella sp. CWC-04]|uniref:Multidrug ABC transporter ATP-binding protein n=1 Tax=Methanooceanicella nereidis TaxID=2052831 RepID=A0AAP2RCX5_9EURY|nr:ABC transporter ATP-binding protein [Methanocella sp. CWC-04]MCD1295234.1 multidrug ABC transporter ATP-binding protein [Methanocella sp. CWC-04]
MIDIKDQPAIAINGLTKKFDKLTAVDNVDLEIKDGEFFGLLGPNGAGKTTLIRTLVGLSIPTSGNATIFGRDVVNDMYESRELIGVVPQEFNFDENLTVKEILTYHAGYYGISRKEREERADRILEFLEIKEKAGQLCNKLSGGMKRRVLIGRALMQQPKVLFLDEPTTGVDVQLRRNLWVMLKELNARGTTIVLTTHYIEEAESLCDRVAIMDHGKIIALGTPEELKRSSDSINRIELEISGNEIPDIKMIPGVLSYSRKEDILTVRVTDTGTAAVALLDYLKTHGVSVRSMHIRESTLEDVFIKLTGREMRD